jgi:hypothetical protein
MTNAINIPGNNKAILCNDGRIKTNNNNNENMRSGCLPYLEWESLRSNHMKNGNKAIKLNLREIRHIENVKNLGAKEKHKVANHLLRKFSVNSPVNMKKPKVDINDNEIV